MGLHTFRGKDGGVWTKDCAHLNEDDQITFLAECLNEYERIGTVEEFREALREKAESDRQINVMERLPCRVGDTVYRLAPANCSSGECPDVDGKDCEYSAFRRPDDAVWCCQERHSLVKEISVYRIVVVLEQGGMQFYVNDGLEAGEGKIFSTPEAALKALKGEAANV